MKYRCTNCGVEFDEPRVYKERHGFTDGSYETWSCCPCCGGDYEEITEEVDDADTD